MPGSGEAGDGVEDTGSLTGRLGAGGGLWIEAAQARAVAGEDGEGEAVAADGGAVDPGDRAFYGEVIEEKAGFEVIGGVEEEVDAIEEVFDVGSAYIDGEGFDLDRAVDGFEVLGGGGGFGLLRGGICFVKEPLALEVGPLDDIAVDEAEVADTGTGQGRGLEGSEGTTADDGDSGSCEASLTVGAERPETNLPRIAVSRQH